MHLNFHIPEEKWKEADELCQEHGMEGAYNILKEREPKTAADRKLLGILAELLWN